jgi:hypothetical protein
MQSLKRLREKLQSRSVISNWKQQRDEKIIKLRETTAISICLNNDFRIN